MGVREGPLYLLRGLYTRVNPETSGILGKVGSAHQPGEESDENAFWVLGQAFPKAPVLPQHPPVFLPASPASPIPQNKDASDPRTSRLGHSRNPSQTIPFFTSVCPPPIVFSFLLILKSFS